jgi:ATP-dependent Clp protease ATP-binding subunit ClpC
MADRYISDRFLPDKAIDLIDEAGSRLRIRRMTAPPELRAYDDKIAEARKAKESAIRKIEQQDAKAAAALRGNNKVEEQRANRIRKENSLSVQKDTKQVQKSTKEKVAATKVVKENKKETVKNTKTTKEATRTAAKLAVPAAALASWVPIRACAELVTVTVKDES